MTRLFTDHKHPPPILSAVQQTGCSTSLRRTTRMGPDRDETLRKSLLHVLYLPHICFSARNAGHSHHSFLFARQQRPFAAGEWPRKTPHSTPPAYRMHQLRSLFPGTQHVQSHHACSPRVSNSACRTTAGDTVSTRGQLVMALVGWLESGRLCCAIATKVCDACGELSSHVSRARGLVEQYAI